MRFESPTCSSVTSKGEKALTDPISPVPRLDLRQVSAKTSPIRGAEQNKGGRVLDHPDLDRGTRRHLGPLPRFIPVNAD
jgi:hypothetical protein